jgi:hypothetical protein
MLLMNMIQHIRLEELPEEVPEGVAAGPRVPEPRSDLAVDVAEDMDDQPPVSPEEEDMYFRQATSGFSAWTSELLQRIFKLYDNMPEVNETSSLKARISSEERVVSLGNVRGTA